MPDNINAATALPPPLKRPASRRGYWIAIIVLAAVLALSLMFNIGMLTGAAARSMHRAGAGEDEFPRLIEQLSYGGGDVKAVRIPLQGMIMRIPESSGLFGARIDRTREILHQIRAARNDDAVAAIVLEVDSPGGAITPTDEIYRELLRFKESRDDRVLIAFTRDMAASGGYYAAVAADWIVAEPTSIIGSIGVIMQSLNWKQLTDDIGVRDVTIKSGPNKDLLNPFRETSDAQIELLQDVINSMYTRFRSIVKQHRQLSDDRLETLADGRILSAGEALNERLIDQIGYWEDVVVRTRELTGVEELRFIRYTRDMDLFTLLTQVHAPWDLDIWADWHMPKMMVLWRP
jgi:protease-4